MRKIAWLIFLMTGTFQVFAQEKSKARKFDEFTDKSTVAVSFYPYREFTLADRIQRYKKELQKNPSSNPYIIFYKGRIIDDARKYDTERWFDVTRQELRTLRRFEDLDKVPQVFGGYREENALELWIVPKGASPPTPSPSIDRSEVVVCPQISVSPDGFYFDKSKPVTFKADAGSDAKETISYKWSASAGELIKGDNTSVIMVDMSKVPSDRVTVTVKLEGLPAPCRDAKSTTIDVGPHPYLFDYAERFNYSELSARTDALMITLNNDPTLMGYVICYSARTGYSPGINYGLKQIRKSFVFRKYSFDQVVLVDGGIRDNATVEMWLLPPGAESPKPTPSVDPRFVKKVKRRRGGDIDY